MYFMNNTKYIKVQALIFHKAQHIYFLKDRVFKGYVNSIYMKIVIEAQIKS